MHMPPPGPSRSRTASTAGSPCEARVRPCDGPIRGRLTLAASVPPRVAAACGLILSLAGPLAAQTRSAATIAAEKDAVDKQIGLQSAAAPAGRPVPGEMGRSAGSVAPRAATVPANDDEDAPISLLGVVSGRVAITRETVRRREEVDRVRKTLQPQIETQKRRKEQYDLEIRKLSEQKWALDQQRDQALSRETSSERRDEIRRRFELQKDLLTEQQDEWERKKNEADAEVERILQDPALAAAEREFNNQLVRDARKFFPQTSP